MGIVVFDNLENEWIRHKIMEIPWHTLVCLQGNSTYVGWRHESVKLRMDTLMRYRTHDHVPYTKDTLLCAYDAYYVNWVTHTHVHLGKLRNKDT